MTFLSGLSKGVRSPKILPLQSQFNAAARHYNPTQTPDYDPQAWSSWHQNCYTYALNIPEHGWGRPGQLMRPYNERSALVWDYDVSKAISYFDTLLKQDGLVRIDDPDPALYAHILFLCLYLDPDIEDQDFHFYRLDSNGTWSHKEGQATPSNQDYSGKIILSPETCDHGARADLVGYYAVPPQGIDYVLP